MYLAEFESSVSIETILEGTSFSFMLILVPVFLKCYVWLLRLEVFLIFILIFPLRVDSVEAVGSVGPLVVLIKCLVMFPRTDFS